MNEPTSSTPQGWQRPAPVPPPRQINRGEAFDQQLASHLSKGWAIESRTDYTAVLVKGKRVNHILHLLLSLVTVGFWIPVWIFVAVTGGEKRKHIAS